MKVLMSGQSLNEIKIKSRAINNELKKKMSFVFRGE